MTKKIIFPLFLIMVLSSCSTFNNRSEHKLAYFHIVYGEGFQNQSIFLKLNNDIHLFITFAKSLGRLNPIPAQSSTYLPKGKNRMILQRSEFIPLNHIYDSNGFEVHKTYTDTLFFEIGVMDSSYMLIDLKDGKIVSKIQSGQYRFIYY